MNKYMMKNLRQAMLSTAAAALVSIGFTACSDETFVTQNTSVPADSYQVIIPASKGGAGTRAITYNGETGGYDATFEVTDKISVYNVTQKAEGMKVRDWGGSQITPLYPDANGKTANLVGELVFSKYETGTRVVITPAVGDELLLLYNNRNLEFSFYYSIGSGEILPDYAIAKVKIESINEGVIKTSAASFENPQSAYRINFTGINSGVKIKKVNMESKQNNLVSGYYPTNIEWPNSFGPVTYTYEGEGIKQRELTFMLRFANNPNYETSESGDVISFRALGSDGHYYVGTKTVKNELMAGLYYLAEVPLTDAGLALTLTNNATGQQVEVSDWNYIRTKDAGYTIKNTGFNNLFEWYGGNNTLTLKDVTIRSKMGCLSVYTDSNDPENTKEHYLVLDGENTLTRTSEGGQAMTVFENSTLHISEASSGGELIVSPYMGISNNAKVILESGVVTINGYLEEYENGCFIISKGGKLRIPNDAWIREGGIKAADGYALLISQDGDYNVYSVIEDDGSGRAKSIIVTPTAVLGYHRTYYDRQKLNVVVMPENTVDKSVTWTTSNPNVVEVDEDGYAYSTGVGTATVTATTKDGSNLSAQCEITVKPIGGIWFEQYEISMTSESPSFINPLTIEGKGVTSVAYTSSDESVATVNASTGEVKIAAGATAGQTAIITARAAVTEDGDYIYWHIEDSYTVKVASTAGQGSREDYEPDTW